MGSKICKRSEVREIHRYPMSSWNNVLGDDWWWRIINSAGDFAYIDQTTLHMSLKERQPLLEYIPQTFKKNSLTGVNVCDICFVKLTAIISSSNMQVLIAN